MSKHMVEHEMPDGENCRASGERGRWCDFFHDMGCGNPHREAQPIREVRAFSYTTSPIYWRPRWCIETYGVKK